MTEVVTDRHRNAITMPPCTASRAVFTAVLFRLHILQHILKFLLINVFIFYSTANYRDRMENNFNNFVTDFSHS